MLDVIDEIEADVIIVTETWLKDEQLPSLTDDLALGSGLGILARNRKPHGNGVCYGGVALLWRNAKINFKGVRTGAVKD